MKLYYKIKYGFKGMDFVSVEAGPDLEKAVYAWSTGNIASIAGKMVNGNNIISIEPHYQKYTGWHETYEPRESADFEQIQRDCPDFANTLPYYQERVKFLMNSNRTAEIGKNVTLPITMDKPRLEQRTARQGSVSMKELLSARVGAKKEPIKYQPSA